MVKKDTYLIIGLLILVVVSPLIITQPSVIDPLNFSEKGQIGDTIGGITAPIVNLTGAFLVYISFREQLRANTIQNRNFTTEQERNNKERRYNSLINDIDNLRIEIREFAYTKRTGNLGVFRELCHELINVLSIIYTLFKNPVSKFNI